MDYKMGFSDGSPKSRSIPFVGRPRNLLDGTLARVGHTRVTGTA